MSSRKMVMVLITVLVIGMIGGIASIWDNQEIKAYDDRIITVKYNDDTPSDPEGGLPRGDPEHPL